MAFLNNRNEMLACIQECSELVGVTSATGTGSKVEGLNNEAGMLMCIGECMSKWKNGGKSVVRQCVEKVLFYDVGDGEILPLSEQINNFMMIQVWVKQQAVWMAEKVFGLADGENSSTYEAPDSNNSGEDEELVVVRLAIASMKLDCVMTFMLRSHCFYVKCSELGPEKKRKRSPLLCAADVVVEDIYTFLYRRCMVAPDATSVLNLSLVQDQKGVRILACIETCIKDYWLLPDAIKTSKEGCATGSVEDVYCKQFGQMLALDVQIYLWVHGIGGLCQLVCGRAACKVLEEHPKPPRQHGESVRFGSAKIVGIRNPVLCGNGKGCDRYDTDENPVVMSVGIPSMDLWCVMKYRQVKRCFEVKCSEWKGFPAPFIIGSAPPGN